MPSWKVYHGLKKLVDDILIWAPDIHNLKTQIEEISQRSMALNVVLSRKKITIGEELPFAGYIVSKNDIAPIKREFLLSGNFQYQRTKQALNLYWVSQIS